MAHRKDLIKLGFKPYVTGTKDTVTYIATMGKSLGKFKKYRIVPEGKRYELYVRK